GAGGVTRIQGGFFLICDRARLLLQRGELDGRRDVQNHRNQQYAADPPQQGGRVAQQFRISVELLAPEKELQISRHVSQDEAEQDDAARGHDDLLTDGRIVEPDSLAQWVVDSCPSHSMFHAARTRSAVFCVFPRIRPGEGLRRAARSALYIFSI